MLEIAKSKLRVSLSDRIEKWWESASGDFDFPYVGRNVYEFMADAALAVLFGIADTQEYLEHEDLMKVE